ncbi:MAG TPA: dipeptidase [Bacteroidota bacterium]|nr:dipeptidase [Bacteroidota bacterium]
MKHCIFAALFLCAAARAQTPVDEEIMARARALSREFIIVDTHIDVPDMLRGHWEDISQRLPDGEFDYPRAKEGGLKAPFMSIFIDAAEEKNGTAHRSADELIDMVVKFTKDWPDKFALASSVADVLRISAAGKIALCMGMENGAPIEGNLENVGYFYKRGIRYITLAHGKDNHISDSSYDTTRTWHGLSPFGKKVVAEMNRVGIMVDVSHISDDAFYQVMEISKAPVIASHSSCRFFTPGFERNMSDDMIRLLASKGGVIQINFGSSFLTEAYRERELAARKVIEEHLARIGLTRADSAGKEYEKVYLREHPLGYADIGDVVAHITHVVQLVGINHVGLGSDFDGLGDELPTGLKDVSQYPNLIYRLIEAGYTEDDIRRICGGNLLRVWTQVENTGYELRARK